MTCGIFAGFEPAKRRSCARYPEETANGCRRVHPSILDRLLPRERRPVAACLGASRRPLKAMWAAVSWHSPTASTSNPANSHDSLNAISANRNFTINLFLPEVPSRLIFQRGARSTAGRQPCRNTQPSSLHFTKPAASLAAPYGPEHSKECSWQRTCPDKG